MGGTIEKWFGKEIQTGICLVPANNEEKAQGRRFISIQLSAFPSSQGFPFLR
jgi:hypothetical protein